MQMAVVGAADGDAVVARGRLDPHVVETGLAREPAVCHAVEAHAPGNAEVLGARRLAQPLGAREQHHLGVVLHAPGHVLPVLDVAALLPIWITVGQPRRVECGGPFGHDELAVAHLGERGEGAGAPIGGKPHHLAALVPIGKDVAGDAAVEGAEPRHEEELVAEEPARRLEPDFLEGFELGAAEPVVALRFARERIDALGELARLVDVDAVVADPVHHHDDALLERAGGKSAVGVREVVRKRDHLVGGGEKERAFGGQAALSRIHELRHVLVGQTRVHILHRQHVAVAHDERHVVEGDALGLEAVVHHLLIEAGVMLLARDALLGDGVCDGAVAQQTCAHVMVVGIYAENVDMLFRHRLFLLICERKYLGTADVWRDSDRRYTPGSRRAIA